MLHWASRFGVLCRSFLNAIVTFKFSSLHEQRPVDAWRAEEGEQLLGYAALPWELCLMGDSSAIRKLGKRDSHRKRLRNAPLTSVKKATAGWGGGKDKNFRKVQKRSINGAEHNPPSQYER